MYASLAITNNSRTILPPSPMYFCTKTLPPNLMNLQYVGELLHALIGEPYNKTPLSRRYWELRRALGASREARGLPLSMWSVCPVHQPSHKCYRVLSRPSLTIPVAQWVDLVRKNLVQPVRIRSQTRRRRVTQIVAFSVLTSIPESMSLSTTKQINS